MKTFRACDGTRIAWYQQRGSGSQPAVLLSHATGFNAGVWTPVTRGFMETGCNVISIDHRNHGRSQRGLVPTSWWDSARDLCILAEKFDRPVIGVGHSMGATTLAVAAANRPELFCGLVLVEPVIAPQPMRRDVDHPIITTTLRRRPIFDSVDAARVSYLRVFSNWEPSALDGYLEAGLETVDAGVRLSCRPDEEAEIYRAGFASGALDHLGRIAAPVSVLVGEKEDTFPITWAQEITSRCRRGSLEVVSGAGHFLPMTHPHAVVEACERLSALLTHL